MRLFVDTTSQALRRTQLETTRCSIPLVPANAGAELEGRDGDGWTPLMKATHGEEPEAVRLLLPGGAGEDLQTIQHSYVQKIDHSSTNLSYNH